MPNGHPDFAAKEKPLLDAFFRPIAPVLEELANQHNLRLTKYYHQFPSWGLTFKHPQGGVGQIELSKETDANLGIAACWWFDDYDESTRYIKWSGVKVIGMNPDDLVHELDLAFQAILGWQFGTWNEKHSPETFRTSWQRFSKEQFQKENVELYPIPKLQAE